MNEILKSIQDGEIAAPTPTLSFRTAPRVEGDDDYTGEKKEEVEQSRQDKKNKEREASSCARSRVFELIRSSSRRAKIPPFVIAGEG